MIVIFVNMGNDILSKKYLLEIYNASEKLRLSDSNKKLSPDTIEKKNHLFNYVDSETGIEVNGIGHCYKCSKTCN